MNLTFESPLNSLSYGQVAYNILREFKRRNINLGFFPIGEVNLNAFQPPKEFVDWLQQSLNQRYSLLDRETKGCKLWHLQGSDVLRTPNQTLLTFHECSVSSPYEKTIVNLQGKTLFSSKYSAEVFSECKNVGNFFCGVDPDFEPQEKKSFKDKTVWQLVGKYERRKATKAIIQAWIKKYGNNKDHVLNLLVTNPFFSPEDNQKLLADAFGGKRWWNVNPLPVLQTNREVVQLINACDIDLSGLSTGEGWNLTAFNAAAMGKWSIVSNHTSHKDWATQENSILVEPDGEMSVYDGIFFKPEAPMNHGVFYTTSEEKMISAMEIAEKKAGQLNESGLLLRQTHSWEKAVDKILEQI